MMHKFRLSKKTLIFGSLFVIAAGVIVVFGVNREPVEGSHQVLIGDIGTASGTVSILDNKISSGHFAANGMDRERAAIASSARADDEATRLMRSTNEELATYYAYADSATRAAIISEIKRRDQRPTKIIGEFFPEMTYDTEHNATITLSRAVAGALMAEASSSARARMEVTHEPVSFTVENTRTTNEIGARLIGAGFDITPGDMQWRHIPDGGEDTFVWVVTPKSEGALQLTVIVRNRVRIGQTVLDLPVDQFPKTITVAADLWTRLGRLFTGADTAIQTAQSIGMGIAALLGVGGIGGLWAFVGFRRRGTDTT